MNPTESRRALLAAIAAAALAVACGAQCAAPQWFAANSIPGVSGGYVLCATTWDPDGPGLAPPELVLGGFFVAAGSELAPGAGSWDGIAWHGIGAGQLTGSVTALAVFNGGIVAANSTFPGSGVVRWNGAAWQPLGTNAGGITALAAFGGQLYAGRSSGPNPIERWDGVAWQPLPPNGLAGVKALAVFNGQLAVASTAAAAVATWDGTTWGALGAAMNGVVSALAVDNGVLVAGGDFTMAGGVPANRIAGWTGAAWAAIGAGLPAPVSSIAVWSGDIVAATWNPGGSAGVVNRFTGGIWQTLGATAANARINVVAERGGELYAAGEFDTIGGLTASRVGRWNGASWSRVGGGLNNDVLTLWSYRDDLIAGGSFTTAEDFDTKGIARFDGAGWHALGSGLASLTGNPAVGALATFNGDLIVGGSFDQAGPVTSVANIARWDGSNWHAIGAGLHGTPYGETPLRVVRALAIYNGEIIAAGYITDSSSQPIAHIARWNGSTWQPLGGGTNGPVHALCVFNGDLYAGGYFSMAGGVAAPNLARWNGSFWQPVGGVGPAGLVESLVVHGGALFAGGDFTTVGALAVNRVARWDGMVWSPLLPLVGNNVVTALASFDGGLVGASTLWALPTGLTAGVARWTGSSWDPLGTGLVLGGSPNQISGMRCLATYKGSLFAAGQILSAGGITSPIVARWAHPLPLIAVSQPNGSGTIRVFDGWLVPGHEYFNIASPDLCPAGVGTGPYGGLCSNDPSVLWQQVTLPLGTPPFHFLASLRSNSFDLSGLPVGFAFEALAVDVTGGVPGCISTPIRYTVY